MNTPIPATIQKEEYQKKYLGKLDRDFGDLDYKNFFIKCYKNDKPTKTYVLKDDLSGEDLVKLDFILKRMGYSSFESLHDIAQYFKKLLDEKKFILLFAYNGTGKTRLSCTFKALGQQLNEDTGEKTADTLYYNAFTEDLFSWDNDLDHDTERLLKLNTESRFFAGLRELEMESRIRPILHRYVDFDFTINYEQSTISFSREIPASGTNQRIDNIKISRGEENIFIWCFFLAIAQLVAEGAEAYNWVRYIYVDDPISSLDDNNAIAVACHLAQRMSSNNIKVIVSTHHSLFFNVLCNELSNAEQLFLQKKSADEKYTLRNTAKTPFFHHVALLKELKKASDSGELYTYHFNILRNILEKTASFHGFSHFSSCLRKGTDEDEPIHKRMVNIFSHGNYSIFDPKEMVEENKEHFRNILRNFLDDYKFNRKLFEDTQTLEGQE